VENKSIGYNLGASLDAADHLLHFVGKDVPAHDFHGLQPPALNWRAQDKSVDLEFSPIQRLLPVILCPNFGPLDCLLTSHGSYSDESLSPG